LIPIEILDRGLYRPLTDRRIFGRDRWAVAVSPRIKINEIEFTVPAGFDTDFSSLPWYVRWKLSPAGRDAIPSVFHDYLLSESDLPKWQIDWIYLGLLKTEGVPDLEAVIKYLSVRTRHAKPSRLPSGAAANPRPSVFLV
jgi:hypothetical protein